MSPQPYRRRLPRWLIGATALVLLGSFLAGLNPAEAQIDNNQPSSAVASIVNCIRSGADLGLSSDGSPRFAVTCQGSAWSQSSYNYQYSLTDGDADRYWKSLISFGNGTPDVGGAEPGHTTWASVGNDGTESDDNGTGSVWGLAYSSGANPNIPAGAPAEARRIRLFAAAYQKRVTRYGDGGPGAIYVIDRVTGTERVYATLPNVVPGPDGYPNDPGDGSRATFPSQDWGYAYTPQMGGVHGLDEDDIAKSYVGKVSLGGVAMDSDEHYLLVLNLNNQTVYAFNTWASNPVAQYPLTLPASVAACPGGAGDFRPFALQYHPDADGTDYGYVGYVCSGETRQWRSDLRAGVLRWQVGVGTVTRVLDFNLEAFDAQRANQGHTIWQPWSNQIFSSYPYERQQPMLTNIEFAEDGSMLLGLHSRTGDIATTEWYPSEYGMGQGDLLRATPNGSGGWNAPSTGAELYNDPDYGAYGPGSYRYQESLWGGLAYVPGTQTGGYGGQVLSTAITPLRNDGNGAMWFDLSGGWPTAKEELYDYGSQTGHFKGSGLGDIELICTWRAIGNRVWKDTNGNGVQDVGEPDLTGVQLQLLNTSGTVLATVTTGTVSGAGDLWRFYVPPFQSYSVRINPAMFNAGQPLYGLSLTAANQGGNEALDSDADAAGVAAIAAGPNNQVNLNYDFGLTDGANIRVSKTGTATVLPTGNIAYSIVVTNDGPGVARGVTAVDTLPAGVSYASASPAPASVSGQTVTWNLGDLAVGASTTITLNATVGSATRGSVTNSVTISTSSSSDSPGDNTDTHVTTIVVPNVYTSKTGTATVLPNGDITYTISYGNNGTAVAAGVSLVDTLPAGVSFVSSTPAPASQSGQTLTWSLGTLAVGSSNTITLVGRASASAASGTVLTNTVSISTTTPGDSTSDNTGTSSTTVVAPNVRITKTGTSTSLPGGLVDYTLSYSNVGTAAAAGVSVVDTLPAGATFVSATPAPASQSGQTLTWNLGTLAVGSSNTISVRVQFATTLSRGATLTNNVSISTSTLGDPPGDNTSSSSTTVIAPNVQITKVGPARITAGDQLTYTLAYTNSGDAAGQGVSIADTLPAGVTFVSATPAPASQSGQTLTWNLGALNAGASGSISLVVQASSSLLDGVTLSNGVTISTTTYGDVPTDNSSTWGTLVERADVAITKSSPSAFPASSNTSVTYYLDYSNNGPALARNVVITDSVPAQITGVSWSCVTGCAASGSGNNLSLTLGDLAAGASGRIVVTGTATTSVAREDFVNTAQISTSTPETSTANNEASVPGAVWTSDLLIIKDASPLAVAGTTFTATLTIRNQGPGPSTGVSVVDTLPAGVSFVSATMVPTSLAGNTVTWNLGVMGDLEERIITLTLRAAATLDGGSSVTNMATTSGTSDRDLSNNADDATTIIRHQADLQLVKDAPARVTAGEQIVYTLTYTNAGPSQARAAVITDTLPSGVTFVSANPAPTIQSGSTLSWALGDLAVGTSGVINVTVATDPIQFDPALTVVNQATITDGGSDDSGGGGLNDDPNPGNNTDDSTTDIETSDVLVLKDMPNFVVAGLAFDATVRVENRGPADALNVTLRDFLPPGMTLLSATPPVSVAPARWNLGTISAGQVVTITLRLRVPSTTPRDALFVNRVIVDTTAPDRDETNNLHEDSTVIRPNADLSVVKDGPAGPLLSGSTVTYTLQWENAGPSLAEDVVISDTVPSGFTFQQARPAPTGNVGGVLAWALGDQDVGASGTITVVGQIITTLASETKVNTARISSITDDPGPSNNTDDASTIVETVDLSITKVGGPLGARAGLPYTYTLTISNAGPATASAVVVSDTLPASLTFLDATPLLATRSGQDLTWALGAIPAGESRTVTLSVAAGTAARGLLSNTASVGSDEPDRDDSNNSSTHDTPITAEADLSIVKGGPAGPLLSGSTVTYTLTYHNNGPALAKAVTVTDTLPPGFTLQQTIPAATSQSGSTLTWVLGDVESGNGGSITVVGRLVGDGVSITRVNLARISSTTDDPTPGDNEDDHPIPVHKPDLSIVKSNGVSSAQPGDILTYSIVVSNTGLVTATGVIVTETPTVGQVQPGDGWLLATTGMYTQTIPQLGAGQIVTLTMRVQLPNPLPAGVERAINITTVRDDGSSGDDPTPDDNSSTDDDPLLFGAVGDLVWIDRNKNGVSDPGEPGLGNVPLELTRPDRTEVLARVTTDSDGGYRFGGLRLGEYAIQIDPAALTGALAEYNITTAPIPVTALTPAQREDMSLDIGLHSPTSAVDLTYLRAERQSDGKVLIRWGTLSERDTARFVVKRTSTPQISPDALIVGQHVSLGSAGSDYRVIDASAPAPDAGPLYYWLVEVETGGRENVYGPARPGAAPSSQFTVYLPQVIR